VTFASNSWTEPLLPVASHTAYPPSNRIRGACCHV
jgi:hypothetical protein